MEIMMEMKLLEDIRTSSQRIQQTYRVKVDFTFTSLGVFADAQELLSLSFNLNSLRHSSTQGSCR